MHVQETSGLGVGLCGFLCVFLSKHVSVSALQPIKTTPEPLGAHL